VAAAASTSTSGRGARVNTAAAAGSENLEHDASLYYIGRGGGTEMTNPTWY